MNRWVERLTVLLALVLFTGGGVVYLFSRAEPPGFTVVRSHGASGRVGGRTLIPGDVVKSGDRVRVGSFALVLVTEGSTPSRVRFAPGSRFRHEGRPAGGASLALRVTGGDGEAALNGGTLILSVQGRDFRVDTGTIRWSTDTGMLQLVRTPGTAIFVLEDGVKRRLRVSELPGGVTLETRRISPGWPSTPHPLSNYDQHSTLRGGDAVIEELLRSAENQAPPESILEVFGHWVRDRWGNVYYYERGKNEIRLRSPGPDEGLFTRDDRIWKRRPTP